MDQQQRMNGDANEDSPSNTNHDVRSVEQKHASDSRDVDMKTAPSSPAAVGRHHPPTTPTPTPTNGPTPPPSEEATTTAVKKSKKRRRIRVKGLKLFHKRGKASSLESPMTTADSDGRLFGQRLDNICQSQSDATTTTTTLPRPIMELLRIIYVGGPSVEGIFRRCANKSICRSVRRQLDSGVVVSEPIDVLIASSLLTEFLRKLPDCLLSCDMYDQWLESSSKSDDEERILSLRQLVRCLPACNLLLLRHLICVLHRINRHCDQTKMTSRNLGVCLGPSLLWSLTTTLDNQRKNVARIVTIVIDLIDHVTHIFGSDCLRLFRDLESCSSLAVFSSSSDQHVDAGIESSDCNSLQRHSGQRSKDESTIPRSHSSNALSSTSSSLDSPSPPAPVAPPRRKRSSVVIPPVFVSIAEESASASAADHSTNPSIAAIVEDKPHLPRSHSSDSASSRDWLQGRSYLTETTDGETMEDSDETSATEEDLDGGHRSEDLLEDDEDFPMASPTLGRHRRDIILSGGQEHYKDGGSETKTSNDVVARDERSWTNYPATRSRDRISAVDPPPLNRSNALLMSFSSTEDSTAAGGGGDRKRLGACAEKSAFFGGSFSSTAGSSDADISNFAESIDSGTAFSESFELQGIIRRQRRQMEVNDVVSNSSSAATTTLQSEDREINAHSNRKHPSSRHQRWSQIDVNWDVGVGVGVGESTTTASNDEHGGAHAISDSAVDDVCEATEISSVTNDLCGPSETDTSGHVVHSRKSSQTPDTSGQTTLRSRRHSFGCRDHGSGGGGGGTDVYGSQSRQRRGMTHKGSDVFPGILPKTLGSRAAGRMLNPNGLDGKSLSGARDGKSLSGAKSDNEARGKFNSNIDRLNNNSDERIIVSDIEFSGESDGKAQSLPRDHHRRTGNTSKTPDSRRASGLPPLEGQDGMQSDKDVVKLDINTRTKLMDDVIEDKHRPSAIRLRMDPPAYEEAVKHLKSQKHSTRVASLTNQPETTVLREEHQKEVEQTTVEAKEGKQKKEQPAEGDCSIRQAKLESVKTIEELDAHALAKLAARSCGDLSKAAELNAADSMNRFPRTEHESKLKHVNSLGSLSSGESLRKRFCIPRSKGWSIRDSSSSSSNNSSDVEAASLQQRRLEDNAAGKKRILRKKRRRSRKARNSDTRLQTDRENRVNIVRSKSDSNTLLRELIFKNKDAEHVRETFRTEISRRKETDDQKSFSRDILQNRQTGKENLNHGTTTIRVRNLDDVDDDDDKLVSTTATREVIRKKSVVALKDRDWHKDLVREIESTQKSESSRCQNSGTSIVPKGSEAKWQIKTKDLCNSSSSFSSTTNKFHNSTKPSNTAASSTLPAAFKCISRIPHGKLLDYSSSDSTKHSIDDSTTHIPEQRSPGRSSDDSAAHRRPGGKPNDEASVSWSGSGGDGSEGSTTSLIELRVSQLRKSDRDFFQRGDANRSKEVIATKDNSNIFHMPPLPPGKIGVQQKPLQSANTLSLDTEHGNKRNSFREKVDTQQPTREIVAKPVIKCTGTEDANDAIISEKVSSDPCKTSTPLFERICVKDIVAIKNSSSSVASGSRHDPTKPPLPVSSRRDEERTEAWKPETGRTVARRSSHVTPQVKPEMDISLTPELTRRTLPRTEQKPRISLGAPLPSYYAAPELGNRLVVPVCGRSQSVKTSSNTRETTTTEVEHKKKNAEAISPNCKTTPATSDASTTSDPNSQRQKHTGVSKALPWQHGTSTSSPLSAKSSNESSRSDGVISSTKPGKVLLRPDAEVVCAFEKGERRMDCGGESATGGGLDSVASQSHGSESTTMDKSTKMEMPWSVANLRNRYGNQNPQ